MSDRSLALQKQKVRTEARQIRQVCANKHQMAVLDACENALKFLKQLPINSTIGLYYPIKDELDCRILIKDLDRYGFETCLPRVTGPDAPLSFHRWAPDDPLVPGPFGTMEPESDAPSVIPDVIICPLLSYDSRGYRLGYGGGY